MRDIVRSALVLAILLAPTTAAAQAPDEWDVPQPGWEGVWKGTVGSSPVHVCLDKTPYDRKGAYYYDRVKRVLRLAAGERDGEWFEQLVYDKNGARWRITDGGDTLVGNWIDGKKQLPVRLARIAGPSRDFEGPCGSMDFHRTRLAPAKLLTKAGKLDGVPFTRWIFKPGAWFEDVAISTFTIDRTGSAIARVNALLRADLPRADGTGDWLECVAANVNSMGADGSYSSSIEPTMITGRWLAARETGEYYCGGAHPESTDVLRTFDLAAGVEVDPLDWLGPRALDRKDLGGGTVSKTLTSDFVKALLAGWKADARECDEAVRSQDYWRAGVARGALVFSPEFPRVIMACSEDFRIPFAKLQPWLNDKGKGVVATLPR